ncbi:hypothetical protein MMC20_001289, partial [Loxospora ochrophaea]|nr:hypothetical protein [Loxospora ochrophaea]
MASASITPPVTYEELAELEKEFYDVDAKLLDIEAELKADLYARRTSLLERIPHFWPIVFNQAPEEISSYIQPSDLPALAALKDFHADRFKGSSRSSNPKVTKDTGMGSVIIRFEFLENEYFSNRIVEKSFWFHRTPSDQAEFVSEPVKIDWRPGKDLTNGLLDLAVDVWKRELDRSERGKDVAKYQELVRRVVESSQMGVSFFAWFGFRGRDSMTTISTKTKTEKGTGESINRDEAAGTDPNEADYEEAEIEREIFPGGEELAIALSEDLYPNALSYF